MLGRSISLGKQDGGSRIETGVIKPVNRSADMAF